MLNTPSVDLFQESHHPFFGPRNSWISGRSDPTKRPKRNAEKNPWMFCRFWPLMLRDQQKAFADGRRSGVVGGAVVYYFWSIAGGGAKSSNNPQPIGSYSECERLFRSLKEMYKQPDSTRFSFVTWILIYVLEWCAHHGLVLPPYTYFSSNVLEILLCFQILLHKIP